MAMKIVYTVLWVVLNVTWGWGKQVPSGGIRPVTTLTCHDSGSLFMTVADIKALRTSPTLPFSSVYTLTSYRKEVVEAETCGVEAVQGSTSLSQCEGSSFGKHLYKRSAICQPCCSTQMSFSVPVTVTDVTTGQQLQAKHYSSSYQVLHLGHCLNEGGQCGYGGTCQQATRIQWLMVEDTSGDRFVPVSVPSHCTCIYS